MKTMNRILQFLIVALAALPAVAKVKVATSLPDLASIASSIGGDQVEVFSIGKANANPHSIEVLPSYMIKVSRVAVYLKVGLGLDGWADAIIDGSRNSDLQITDCSVGIPVLEKPAGKTDASMGDVHPLGNPHYWLDPANGGIIADNIRDALRKADPAHGDYFAANAEKFKAENAKRVEVWKAKMTPLKGAAIITYHSSWVYFARAFDFRIVGYVEPFPGIPPTAKHLQELIDRIKAEKAKILIQEPYYQDKDPRFLERQAGVRIFRFSPSCAGPAAGEYWKHFEDIIAALASGG